MAETTAAPAAQTPTPAATAAPAAPARAPIPDADALLAEATAQLTAAQTTPEAAPAPAKADAPAETKQEPAAADPAADPETTKRLARIAGEQRRLDKAKAEWKRETAAQAEAAANWTRVQEAKTKGERMTALRALFDDGEITGALYQDMTDLVYGQAAGGTGLTKADAEKLVADQIAATTKAAADAAAKAAADEAAARAAKAADVQVGYLKYVDSTFNAARDKYPAVAKFPPTGPEIIAYTESHYAEHKAAPAAEDVLAHFEAAARAKIAELNPPPAGKPTTTVTSSWGNDAPPRTGRRSLEDVTDEAMREAGIPVR